MRAVNLIPADQRRAAGAAGKSGGAAYALLGALGMLVLAVAVLTLTNRSVADKQAEATRLEAQAQAAQTKAGALASYEQFNRFVKTRSTAVQTLAATRFDWGTKLEQVSRVIPADVPLTQLAATTAPGLGIGGVVGTRSNVASPAIELVGCAPSQARVALLMARLRRLEGVERVSIASSVKVDANGDAASSSESTSAVTGCQATDKVPKFQIVAFFGAAGTTAETSVAGVKGAIDTLNGGTSGTTPTPAPATPGS
jgi:Tfp pilus assembly protein PilN